MLYACLGRVAGLTFRQVRRRPHVLRAVATDADLEKALQAKSPFLREFASRGYLAQCTDIEGLDEKLTEGRVSACVEINQCVGGTRQFFTESFLGDDAAVLAPSSGEEPAPPRHRAGVASMAWRSTRRFRTNAP